MAAHIQLFGLTIFENNYILYGLVFFGINLHNPLPISYDLMCKFIS